MEGTRILQSRIEERRLAKLINAYMDDYKTATSAVNSKVRSLEEGGMNDVKRRAVTFMFRGDQR